MSISEFVRTKPYLFWSVNKPENLSEGSIVEAVLNYGNFDDVKQMIAILGIERTTEIFLRQIQNSRNNYRPEIKNYFKLYFTKYNH